MEFEVVLSVMIWVRGDQPGIAGYTARPQYAKTFREPVTTPPVPYSISKAVCACSRRGEEWLGQMGTDLRCETVSVVYGLEEVPQDV